MKVVENPHVEKTPLARLVAAHQSWLSMS